MRTITNIILVILSLVHASRVDTLLFAPWTSSSQSSLLEAAEFFSYYGVDNYFSFIQSLVSVEKEMENAKEMESWIMQFCSENYPSDVCSLLKLSLKSREMLPKVAMFQNIATPFVSLCPESDSFLVSPTFYACSVNEIELQQPYPANFALDKSQREELLSHQEFDHMILPSLTTSSERPFGTLFSSYKRDLQQWLSVLNVESARPFLIRPFHSVSTHPVEQTRLGGYGIALDIKNTEYKVLDDRSAMGVRLAENEVEAELETELQGFHFATLKARYPDLTTSLQAFKESLQEEASHTTAESIPPLQLKDLGVKTVQRIMHSQDPLKQFQEIACNLPAVAASVARVPVEDRLKKKAVRVSEEWQGMVGQVLVNGQRLTLDNTAFNLFEFQSALRTTLDFQQQCLQVGLNHTAQRTVSQIVNELHQRGGDEAIPVRLSQSVLSSPHILYVNDIQRDRRYSHFSGSVRRFLMPLFQLPTIKANYLSRVLVIDPMQVDLAILQTSYEMIQQGYPVQFGFVFHSEEAMMELKMERKPVIGRNPLSPGQLLLFCASFTKENALAAIVFLNNFLAGSDRSVRGALQLYEMLLEEDGQAILEDDRFREQVLSTGEWVQSLGLTSGVELLNGQVMAIQSMDSFFQHASAELNEIVKGVSEEEIKKVADIRDYLYKHSRVFDVYLPQLTESFADQTFVDVPPSLTEKTTGKLREGTNGVVMTAIASISQLISLIPFLSTELMGYSVYVTTPSALTPILSITQAMMNNQLDSACGEVLFCLAEKVSEKKKKKKTSDNENMNEEIQQCLDIYLDEEELVVFGTAWQDHQEEAEWNEQAWKWMMGEEDDDDDDEKEGAKMIVNGRVVQLPMLSASVLRIVLDVDQSVSKPLREAFPEHNLMTLLPFIHHHLQSFQQTVFEFPRSSPFLLQYNPPSSSSSSSSSSSDTTQKDYHNDDHDESVVFIQAVIDPLSPIAQRLSSILLALRAILPIHYEILLLPGHDYSSIPLKRFYRYVFEDKEIATWQNLPQHYVYTMSTEVPYKWNVIAYYAESDLDNLRVTDDYTYILAQYVVDGIIIEGSCYTAEHKPASGVMLQLTPYGKHSVVSDTVVMNKGGYWQLRGGMGLYEVTISEDSPGKQLIDGLGDEVNKINIYNWNHLDTEVALSLKDISKEKRTEDKEAKTSKNQPKKETKSSLVDKIKTSLFSRSPKSVGESLTEMAEESEEVINVFSLASGHLYERFLKIMMKSVSSGASKKIHFWLIENFLSPQFKDMVPSLCSHYGYNVSYVSYKWPRWVWPQTEKQRIIWAYKILFLDVLFPLKVKKIIYVDADQVSRVDINELWEMDIHDHVYAYTPLCTSNEETKGFMFWTQGYWKDHLRGRPYHISALYKVDLELLRKRGVGDILRGVYNGLAPDPNSLSNLDQDLPNFIQDQVPIYSLPQEWLWCESWCSMESKKTAKTIDLCNNPLYKEPKLDMAKRVISGPLFKNDWVTLDEDIHAFEEAVLQKGSRRKPMQFELQQ